MYKGHSFPRNGKHIFFLFLQIPRPQLPTKHSGALLASPCKDVVLPIRHFLLRLANIDARGVKISSFIQDSPK